jgi:hypothetical protein
VWAGVGVVGCRCGCGCGCVVWVRVCASVCVGGVCGGMGGVCVSVDGQPEAQQLYRKFTTNSTFFLLLKNAPNFANLINSKKTRSFKGFRRSEAEKN